MRDITRIVIHHSDSPAGRGDDAETIHHWHLDRGWSGIGYHHVITETGEVQNGRPHYWEGAHVRGFNEGSIGICLIGSGDFNHAQLKALKGLLRYLVKDYPDAVIVGHRDLDPNTECPGFDVRDIVDEALGV